MGIFKRFRKYREERMMRSMINEEMQTTEFMVWLSKQFDISDEKTKEEIIYLFKIRGDCGWKKANSKNC